MRVRGTREWAVAEIDCCTGCSHRCRYCYARHKLVVREKRIDPERWSVPLVENEQIERVYRKYPGPVMFPANHDIEPTTIDDCLTVLKNLLSSGNTVLIVSKPHLECIEKICLRLQSYSSQILFRFSITAGDDALLRFWEPGAPGYNERLASLRYGYESGFATSVSIEPMLDGAGVTALVAQLTPYVNHSIWVGKMNKIDRRVVCDSPEMARAIERIRTGQTDERIRQIYQQLKNHPLIRWKESIKEVVGLQLAHKPGQDI